MSSDDHEAVRIGRTLVFAAVGSLLVVMILLVLLHLYAKYLLNHRERSRQSRGGGRVTLYSRTTELEQAVHEVNSNETRKTGLDQSTIALLPIFKYKRNERLDHGEAVEECSVCLSAIVEDATVRVLPNCKHMFHSECIDMWLDSHTTCPICRNTAEPRVQPTAPPLVESGLDGGAALSEKVGGSGSRLSRNTAEPRVQPTAPPLVESGLDSGAALSEKVGGSGSRLSSFRRMMGRDRSSSRIQSREEIGAEDLERQ